LAGARTGIEKTLLEGKDIAVAMDTSAVLLAAQARIQYASTSKVKGEGGVSSMKLKTSWFSRRPHIKALCAVRIAALAIRLYYNFIIGIELTKVSILLMLLGELVVLNRS
jgi:hypothetical protein